MVENLTGSSQQETDGTGRSPPGVELSDHQKQQDEELVVTSPSSEDVIDDDDIIDGTCGGFGGCDGCELTEHIGEIDATLGGCAVTEHWTCGADLSFTDEDEIQARQLERGVTRTRRLALCLRVSGMVGMTLLNPLCCVLAMEYASPSILAPFSGLTLVWIISFSEVLVGEKPTRIQKVAAGLIICGETIVALFGDHTNPNKSIDDVRASYLDPLFLVYLVCMVLWMAVLGCAIVSSHFSDTTFRRFAFGVSGGTITGLQNFLKDSLTVSLFFGLTRYIECGMCTLTTHAFHFPLSTFPRIDHQSSGSGRSVPLVLSYTCYSGCGDILHRAALSDCMHETVRCHFFKRHVCRVICCFGVNYVHHSLLHISGLERHNQLHHVSVWHHGPVGRSCRSPS